MLTQPPAVFRFRSIAGLAAVVLLATLNGTALRAQNKREFSVSARKYGFQVAGINNAEIHVQQDDLVRITFVAEDIPHSFTTVEEPADAHYRINKRAEPGKPVTFDFRADKAGRVQFTCTLTADARCREMTGWIIVDAKPGR